VKRKETAADYDFKPLPLDSKLPTVDDSRMGCTFGSGGGQNPMWGRWNRCIYDEGHALVHSDHHSKTVRDDEAYLLLPKIAGRSGARDTPDQADRLTCRIPFGSFAKQHEACSRVEQREGRWLDLFDPYGDQFLTFSSPVLLS